MKKFYRSPDGKVYPVSILEDVELHGSHYAVVASPGLIGSATIEIEDSEQEMVTHGMLIVDWDKLSEQEPAKPNEIKRGGRLSRLASLVTPRQ